MAIGQTVSSEIVKVDYTKDRDHRRHRQQFIEHRRYVKIQLETVVEAYETIVARRYKNKRK
jgi:hypothetical protein